MKKTLVTVMMLVAAQNTFALSEVCVKEGASAIVNWMKTEEPTSAPELVLNKQGEVIAITDKNFVWIDDGKDNQVYLTPIDNGLISFEDLTGSSAFEVQVEEVISQDGNLSCKVGEPYFTQID